MTTTAPPPIPEDIPGVTRRHRFSDLYHERTNFQFIKHTKRWLILSTTLMVLSVLLVGFRGLNFGIEFKGGTAWTVDMKNGKTADIDEVRDALKDTGFGDAKVKLINGGETVNVQARVIDDPTILISQELAKYAGVTQAEVLFQPGEPESSFAFTAKEGVKPTKEAVLAAIAAQKLTKPDVTINGNDVTIKVKELPQSPAEDVAVALAKYSGAKVNEVSINRVGPSWGREVSKKAIKALIIFFLILAIYLSIRFEFKMAMSAIVAVIHDIVFTIGAYALFQFDVTPATVTAFLTILGFSLYDTVVVFDKVSENERALTATGRSTYGDMVNKSLNQVLMRSLSTSVVALLPVMSLLIIGSGVMGATALEEFALALAAGLFIGSYSSLFVAAPLLAFWKEREPRYRLLAERKQRVTMAAASASTGVPVVVSDEVPEPDEVSTLGVPGPPAVPRGPIQPRARQQRGRKRK